MPRILIAGCGYVGHATADLFHAAGWAVEGWTRSATSAARLSTKPYRVCRVDISEQTQVLSHTPADAGFDAVIHCVSSRGGGVESYRQIYLHGARTLIDRFVCKNMLFRCRTLDNATR